MKRIQAISMVVLSAGLVLAQSQSTNNQTAPANQPAAGAGQQQPAGQQPAAAPVQRGKTPPAAKSQAEMTAYNQVMAQVQAKNAAGAEQAADALANNFKDSELRYLGYFQTMLLYQAENNADKAIEMGRKVLAINPNEPVTLAMVASFVSERTRDSDLDRDQRLAEVVQNAQKSLQLIDTELVIPPTAPQEQVDANKALLRSMAYAAIGNAYLVKADYPHAEENLKKSVEIAPAPGDSINWLRYAVALDLQNKLKDAMTAIDKAIELAPAGSLQAKMAQDERKRLVQRAGAAVSKPASQSSTK